MVTIGGVNCTVTAATTSSITCDVGNGPVGEHKVKVNVGGKGLASHSSGDVMFSYTADISGISPTTGSLGGKTAYYINYFTLLGPNVFRFLLVVMSCLASQLIFLEYHQLQEVLEVRLLIIITRLHYLVQMCSGSC